ncbi:EamA family transporter [uncultured Brevundimonas sp.]|uniref:DMT family transporter n=1 Tax=uncultured Brevundimonas sp. TaxID=213418 RepID=UPI0026385DD2|nr:EamA family transporter [uncultured Brevundimonas sp.]
MSRPFTIIAIAVCALIWGTTWFAITLQLGPVDPIASIVWRFGLAAVVLFAFCALTRRPLKLTRAQHLAAVGQGAFVFAVSYGFVYAAEERVASAVVAVIFAALAFVNLVLFRIVSGQKAAPGAWQGALLGVCGVAVLSFGQLTGAAGAGAGLDPPLGVIFALVAVLASAVGNWFAWRGQQAGAPVLGATAWAMGYGMVMLAIYGFATGVEWRIEPTPAYILSLLHLSLFGSVIAFGLYFTLARQRGYALASYISALTPPIAVIMSVVFEGAQVGASMLVGLGLVLGGQVLLIRAPKPD